MNVPVTLRNRSAAGVVDDLSLRVAYFVKSEQGDPVPKADSYTPDASGDVSVAFGDGLALQKEVFFTLLAKGTNTLTQLSTVGDKLRDGSPIEIEYDYSPVTLAEPAEPAPHPAAQFVYGRLLEKNGRGKMEDVQI